MKIKSERPKITIFTTVKNSVDTIEAAILSVINQGYDNLEYIVIDGGSTDGTVDIIKKYASYMSHWESRDDQCPDYNVGLEYMTGDFIGFLNGDDWYELGVFDAVATKMTSVEHVDVVTVCGRVVEESNGEYYPVLQYATKDKLQLSVKNICFGVSAICSRFFNASIFKNGLKFNNFNDDCTINRCSDIELLLSLVINNKINEKFLPCLGHTYRLHDKSSGFNYKSPYRKEVCKSRIEISDRLLKVVKKASFDYFIILMFRLHSESRFFFHSILKGELGMGMHLLLNKLKKADALFLLALCYLPLSVFYCRYIYYKRYYVFIQRLLRRCLST